jgi:hypothetical protein
LLIDHHAQPVKREPLGSLQNASVANFSDLKRNMTSRSHNAREFQKRFAHHSLPCGLSTVMGDGNILDVNPSEPATQPIVICILYNVQERRRRYYEGN